MKYFCSVGQSLSHCPQTSLVLVCTCPDMWWYSSTTHVKEIQTPSCILFLAFKNTAGKTPGYSLERPYHPPPCNLSMKTNCVQPLDGTLKKISKNERWGENRPGVGENHHLCVMQPNLKTSKRVQDWEAAVLVFLETAINFTSCRCRYIAFDWPLEPTVGMYSE